MRFKLFLGIDNSLIVKLLTISIIIVLAFIGCSHNIDQKKYISITIDDLPTLSHGLLSEQEQINYYREILNTLDKYKVKTLGFVVGRSITENNEMLIQEFIARGHVIGNHTYNHFDLNSVEPTLFIKDIEKCQSKLSEFNVSKRYFRYPMLHRGDSIYKKEVVYEYLNINNYKIIPVSIDTDEPDFNLRFVKAYCSGDSILAQEIGKEYVEHMKDQTLYFDGLYKKHKSQPIKHILLLHMNFVNSFYLDEILKWYTANNWEFIDIENAMTDPLYNMPDKYIGKKGQSYIIRVYPEKT